MHHKDRKVVRSVALATILAAEKKGRPFFVHRGALCQYDGRSYRVCGENELSAEVCGQFDDLVQETNFISGLLISAEAKWDLVVIFPGWRRGCR